MDHSRTDLLTPARLILASLGLALVWLLLSFVLGSDSARADDHDSPLGGNVSGVTEAVEAPATRDVSASVSAVSAVVTPVTDATPASGQKVAAAIPAVRSAVTEVVHASPVAPIVAPVAAAVDEVAAALPVVTEVVGTSPVAEITEPVTAVVNDVLAETVGATLELPVLPALPGAPILDGVDVPAGDAATASAAVTAASVTAASALSTAFVPMSSSWAVNVNAAHTNVGSGASSIAFARSHPDPVPRGPADNGNSAALNPSGANAGAASGGPTGPTSAADAGPAATPALITGALLSHAENDALPSPLVGELSSTPD